jgi:hypothetical protein
MNSYLNHLSISHKIKGIPYGGSEVKREDGEANHGFKPLKRNPFLIEKIPEALLDEALRNLLVEINCPDTSLFSVGCSSSDISDEKGFRVSGYIEFAVNSKEAVSDARVYFPMFFHFDRLLYENKFSDQIKFDWEIMSAYFIDSNVDGFTCAVFVNTFYFQTKDEAKYFWKKAMDLLAQFLFSVRGIHGANIY